MMRRIGVLGLNPFFWRAAVGAAAVFSLSNCHMLRAPAPKPPISGVELSSGEAEDLFEQLQLKDWEIFNLRSMWRVVVSRGGTKAVFRYVVVYQKPDRLRLEVLPLGAAHTQSLLLCREGRGTLLDPAARTAYESTRPAELLSQVLNLPLVPGDFMALITGRVPGRFVKRRSASGELKVFYDGSLEDYAIFSSGFEKYWLLAKGRLLLKALEMRSPFHESLVLRMDYEAYGGAGDFEVPYHIQMQLPGQGIKAQLELMSAVINQEIQERVFEVQVPPDYTVKRKD